MTTLTASERDVIRQLAAKEKARYLEKSESGRTLTSNDEKRFDFADFSFRLLTHIDALAEERKAEREQLQHAGRIKAALRAAFPHFQDESPITPQTIREIGRAEKGAGIEMTTQPEITRYEDKAMNTWNQYRRKGVSEMRPYVKGEDLTGISVSDADDPPNDMGMIARNPKNHADQWYVARQYFEDNLERVCAECGSAALYEDRVDQQKGVIHCDECGAEMPK